MQRKSEGDRFAVALARAMADPTLRAELRDAFRDSRLTDHKLSLQEFAAKATSGALVGSAAVRTGSSPWRLLDSLPSLPEMDLYVPFREHRRTWRATDDVLVAVAFDANAPTLETYDVRGHLVVLRLEDGVPRRPLVIMHPAEPKFTRASNQPVGIGAIIEPDCEPTLRSELSSSEEDCGGGGGGGGGGPTPPAPGVYITGFFSPRGDGWFGSSLEMEFYSGVRSGSLNTTLDNSNNVLWFFGQACNTGSTTRVFQKNTQYNNLLIMLSPGISNVGSVSCPSGGFPSEYMLRLVESDGGLNGPSDDFGRRFYGVLGGTSIPWNASVSGFHDFYSCSATTYTVYQQCPPQFSARVRLEYR